jgi:murein L,D-transpeptidase YcbB/YkuD
MDARVVAGSQKVRAERERVLHQESPADPAVAQQARIGSPAAGIVGDHRRHHLAAEKLLRIDDVKGNIQLLRDPAGERDGV